jgi:Tol biopolymer transport system component
MWRQDRVSPSGLLCWIGPDGRVVYAAQMGGKWRIVVDEEKGDLFDSVEVPVFSPDGKQMAYVASDAGKQFIVTGSKSISPKFGEVRWLAYSPEGRLVYEVGNGNTYQIGVDDWTGAQFRSYSSEVMSPDDRRRAYEEYTDGPGSRILIEDKVSEPFGGIWSPVFSPDGKKVAFGAWEGNELWWKVMDVGE